MPDDELPALFLKSEIFKRTWDQLPIAIQRISVKKLRLLAENQRHPSLQIHLVYRTREPTWICYLSKQYRVLFQHTEDDKILLLEIGSHTIIDRLHRKKYRSPQIKKKVRYRSKRGDQR